MEVSAVAKILQDDGAATRVLVPGDEREPEVLFSCRYDRATGQCRREASFSLQCDRWCPSLRRAQTRTRSHFIA